MIELKSFTYEECRKKYFEGLLAQKNRQLKYWGKRDDFERLEDIGMEISYIEDAIKALDNSEKHLCSTCSENAYGSCKTQNMIVCKNYRRKEE